MEITFQTGTLLLLVAAVVAMLTRRLRLPYSVGLVIAGIALTGLPFAPKVNLTKDLLFNSVASATFIRGCILHSLAPASAQFSRHSGAWPPSASYFSACVTARECIFLRIGNGLPHWAFGVSIAATDPVQVIATFKEAKVHGRLLVLVEAESLLNDGTAAVAFGVVIALASGQQVSSVEIATMLLKTIGGGIVCGGAVALGALLLTGRTDDHLVEITFTTVAAYGSFLLADHFGLSGVLAQITAGLVTSNFLPPGGIWESCKAIRIDILAICSLCCKIAGVSF